MNKQINKYPNLLCKSWTLPRTYGDDAEKEGRKYLLLFNHSSLRFTKNNDRGEEVILEECP